MNLSIANHNNEKNPKGFMNYSDIDFMDIPDIVKSGHAYAAGRFKDNHRSNKNWQGHENVLILDIDEHCTIEAAKNIFAKYRNFIITSRSHQKLKNGVACDRFRVFILLSSVIDDYSERERFISTIMEHYFFIDKSTKDGGRFFFASPEDAKVFYNNGKPMDVVILNNKLKDEEKKTVQENNEVSTNIYKYDELKEIWIDEAGNVLEAFISEDGTNYEAKLKGASVVLENEFYSGNRANCIFKVAAMLKNDGLDDDSIANFLISENDKRDSLSLRELMSNMKSGLRR